MHSTRSHFKSVFSPLFSRGIFILLNPPLGNSFLLEKASFPLLSRGVKSWGLRVATPRFWTGGSQGRWQGGRWSRGRVVKYYYISYHVQEVCSKVVTFEEK